MRTLISIKLIIFSLILNSLYAVEREEHCEETKNYLDKINDEVDKFDTVIKEHVSIFSTEVAMYSRDISKEIENRINDNYLDRKKVVDDVEDIQAKVEADLLQAIEQRNAYDRYIYYSMCTILTPVISWAAYDEDSYVERELGQNVLNDRMIAMFPIKNAVLTSCLAIFPVLGLYYDKINHAENKAKRNIDKIIKASKGTRRFPVYQVVEELIKTNPGKVVGATTLGSALLFGIPFYVAHKYQTEDVEQEQDNVNGIRSTITRHMNTMAKFYNTYYFHLDLQKQVQKDYQYNCKSPENP